MYITQLRSLLLTSQQNFLTHKPQPLTYQRLERKELIFSYSANSKIIKMSETKTNNENSRTPLVQFNNPTTFDPLTTNFYQTSLKQNFKYRQRNQTRIDKLHKYGTRKLEIQFKRQRQAWNEQRRVSTTWSLLTLDENQLRKVTQNDTYINHYIENKVKGDQRMDEYFNGIDDKYAVKEAKILTSDTLQSATGLSLSEIMPSELSLRFDASYGTLLQLQHIDTCPGIHFTKHV